MFSLRRITALSGSYTYIKPHYGITLHRSPLIPCILCKRQVSQAFYEQFLSPNCLPIGAVRSLLELVHSYTGMPWWASLAVTTATLRTVLTFPLMVYSMNNTTKLECLQSEIKNLSKELSVEVALAKAKYQWNDNTAQCYFRINVWNSLGDNSCL